MKNEYNPSLNHISGNSIDLTDNTRRDKTITIISLNYLKNIREDLLEEEPTTKTVIKDTIIYVKAEVITSTTTIMIDTGADVSIINSVELYRLETENKLTFPTLPINNISIIGATGKLNKTVRKQVMLEVTSKGITITFIFLVATGLPFDILIGCDMLRQYTAVIDLCKYQVTLKTNEETWVADITNDRRRTVQNTCYNIYNDEETWEEKIREIRDFVRNRELDNLQPEDAEKLIAIYDRYRHVFSDAPGKVKDYQCQIRFREPANFQRKSYPIAHSLKEAVREEILRMLADDIIEYSQSPFTNPIVAIPKKNGQIRLCLDAREINKIIINDRTSPGEIDEIMKRFHGTKYMSTWDTVCGYWQVELHPDSRKYMAFIFDGRNYQFKRLPFGLVNSVAVFVKCMDQVLGQETLKFATVYVDDILVTSATWNEHCLRVEQVLQKLSENHVTLKLDKSRLIAREVQFLGFILSDGGIIPSPEKIDVIQKFPTPTKKKHLQSFLGVCNYYRRFQRNYSELTTKFKKQLSAKEKWTWGPEEDKIFQTIKDKFIETVMLFHPNFTKPFFMNCDASDTSLGAELYQEDEDGEHLVIGFISRTLNQCERNYNVTEKELLSIVYACGKFRTFILGYPITVRTDHKSIAFFRNCKLSHGRLTRWTLTLQEYNITYEYVPGKKNIVADCLSRVNWNDKTFEAEKGDQLQIFNIRMNILELNNIIQELKRAQQQDEKSLKIKQRIQENDETIQQYYQIHQDVLFIKPNIRQDRWKIVVPTDAEPNIIMDYHQRYGHMGTLKVAKAMEEHFYMKNIQKKVQRNINRCHICQLVKYNNDRKEGVMIPITSTHKLEKIFLDICGPFPRSGGRHRYRFIVIMLDHFTRYVKLYPITKATTRAILNIIIHLYLPTVGVPKCIITDHGTQFRSRLFRRELLGLGIKTYKISVGHPSSNPAERVLREVARILRTYCHNDQRRWSEYMKDTEDFLNLSYHHYLDETPYTVMFNEPPPRAITEIINFPPNEQIPFEVVRFYNHIREKTKKQRQKYELANHKAIKYNTGDKILLKNREHPSTVKGIMKKLLLLYIGPFVVTKDNKNNTYEITDPTTNKVRGTYNQASMKRYHE